MSLLSHVFTTHKGYCVVISIPLVLYVEIVYHHHNSSRVSFSFSFFFFRVGVLHMYVQSFGKAPESTHTRVKLRASGGMSYPFGPILVEYHGPRQTPVHCKKGAIF